jgi:hypothetical protein
MPRPTNSPHVKVVQTSDGKFMPQFTTDNLSWFNLLREATSDKQTAISVAVSFDEAVNGIGCVGKTVFEAA